jgi:4-hydroxy-3-polyprenylbenzoate decarboxylase
MTAKSILVGATGASGFPVLIRVLELIQRDPAWSAGLILTEAAELTLAQETDLTVEALCGLADRVYDSGDLGAGPASGSFENAGMVIVPCSMKTLAGIHAGYAENLLLRAADVTIKEQRPLVLGVRECPLSPIHLRNMQELSMIPGVHITPLMMNFYTRPKTLDEMVTQVACRLLTPFGISPGKFRRWDGMQCNQT